MLACCLLIASHLLCYRNLGSMGCNTACLPPLIVPCLILSRSLMGSVTAACFDRPVCPRPLVSVLSLFRDAEFVVCCRPFVFPFTRKCQVSLLLLRLFLIFGCFFLDARKSPSESRSARVTQP